MNSRFIIPLRFISPSSPVAGFYAYLPKYLRIYSQHCCNHFQNRRALWTLENDSRLNRRKYIRSTQTLFIQHLGTHTCKVLVPSNDRACISDIRFDTFRVEIRRPYALFLPRCNLNQTASRSNRLSSVTPAIPRCNACRRRLLNV